MAGITRRSAVAALAALLAKQSNASARKQRVQQGVQVVNSGNGDVNVDQSVQVIAYSTSNVGDGNLVTSPCRPGDVVANPDTGILYFIGRDCCYHYCRFYD